MRTRIIVTIARSILVGGSCTALPLVPTPYTNMPTLSALGHLVPAPDIYKSLPPSTVAKTPNYLKAFPDSFNWSCCGAPNGTRICTKSNHAPWMPEVGPTRS